MNRFVFAVIFVIVACLIFGSYIFVHSTLNTVTFTVKDKAITTNCSGQNGCKSRYMIYTDKGVYRDGDSFWFFKFNSSDLYGKLEKGKSYICKVTGLRIPLLSSYKNLISCTQV